MFIYREDYNYIIQYVRIAKMKVYIAQETPPSRFHMSIRLGL